jgi:hypothetical protein
MLRSLKGSELEPALKQFLRQTALNEVDEQRNFVVAELALAWATGKLGPIEVSGASLRLFEQASIGWQSLFESGLVDDNP